MCVVRTHIRTACASTIADYIRNLKCACCATQVLVSLEDLDSI